MTKIRIKDIARIANVSPGTVDRVIHKRGGVSEESRLRIESIIQETGYQRDILAGALATKRTYRILVCMPETVHAHAFWKFPEMGVNKAMSEFGHFDLEVEFLRFNQHNNENFLDLTKSVDPSAFDGLLFAPVFREESIEFLKKWKRTGRPVVLFNSNLPDISYEGYIGQDAIQSAYLGGRLMSFGLGREKDLLIVNLSLRKANYDHIIRREKGFKAYFEEHSDRINNLVTIDLHGGDYELVARELDIKMTEFDVAGIFVTNSRVHLIARYLEERGAMNVRLIGYDLLPESIEYLKREYIDFLLSQSPEEQAYLGIRALFNMIVLKHDEPGEVLLPIDILTKENIEYYLKFNEHYEQSK